MPTLYYTSVKENLFLFLHTGLYALLWFECAPLPPTQQGRLHCLFEILSFRMFSWCLESSDIFAQIMRQLGGGGHPWCIWA